MYEEQIKICLLHLFIEENSVRGFGVEIQKGQHDVHATLILYSINVHVKRIFLRLY